MKGTSIHDGLVHFDFQGRKSASVQWKSACVVLLLLPGELKWTAVSRAIGTLEVLQNSSVFSLPSSAFAAGTHLNQHFMQVNFDRSSLNSRIWRCGALWSRSAAHSTCTVVVSYQFIVYVQNLPTGSSLEEHLAAMQNDCVQSLQCLPRQRIHDVLIGAVVFQQQRHSWNEPNIATDVGIPEFLHFCERDWELIAVVCHIGICLHGVVPRIVVVNSLWPLVMVNFDETTLTVT